jgi:hypothetical protein
VRDRTSALQAKIPSTREAVLHTVEVAELFTSLARNLDQGGFTAKEQARVFVRTLIDYGARLHGRAVGSERS